MYLIFIAITQEISDTLEEVTPHVDPPKGLDPWLDNFSSWTHAQRLGKVSNKMSITTIFVRKLC